MGRVLFVGVLEFTAPLGHVILPDWMLNFLNVKEKEWVKVEYLKVHPPVGISVIFKPVSKGFSMIDDPKSLLEAKLRHFSVMSEGEILPIQYRDSIHELEVVETNPKDVIDIVNIDLEVIFVKSLQSEAEEDGSSDNDSSLKSHEGIPDYDWVFWDNTVHQIKNNCHLALNFNEGGEILHFCRTQAGCLKRIFGYFLIKESKWSEITLHESWFIGDVIESDGRLWIATEFDPIFLALPYLKEGKRVPLDHLILESRITDSPFLKNRLPLVADPIGNADLNVWKLNDDKCMEYLSKKVKAIAKVLSENSIHIDSTSAEGFSKSSSTKGVEEHYLKYSWGLISDYIDKETSIQLKSHMNIITDETTTNKRRSSSSGEGSSKGLKRVKSAPQEDYLSLPKETRASLPQNSKQKALAKSATGSKNITSFFSKK
ncbi:RNASEH2B [Lepeophtheirus salmonis]|uniref:RNASEH2B n=1 Tax=Lepeophtheirus salmonis TaxID=72036 RepID=A0A7R8GZZ5_LEPSM|nr:RNASEH2B [Lepeophtheirus salmonis]CAF2776280.1 RNASEH2B [Lepeophtheirus salmonis]